MSDNTQHSEHFEELCSAYVLNALDTDEQKEFEGILQEATQDELEIFYAMHSTANQMAFTAERAEPSQAVLDRIMNQIRSQPSRSGGTATSKEADDQSGFSWAALAIAASFALLLITLALVFYSFNLNSEINDQQSIIEEQRAQITELKNEVQRKEELLSILEARTIDLIVMSGLEINPNGYGKVIWDPNKQQALLQVSNLPPVPADKDYQLWLIKNNKPIPSGVFAVNDPAEDSFFKIEELAEADRKTANTFAITLEPKGGSQQPTGNMYLLGNVQGDAN